MLVVMSDLHFVDATAGCQNLPVETFKNMFLTDIVGLIREKGVSDVQVLLLGDTVDLLRTAQWLDVDAEDRPWGENGIADVGKVSPSNSPTKTEIHCRQILGRMPEIGTERFADNETSILYQNWETFEFFRNLQSIINHELRNGSSAKPVPEVSVQVIYLVGNHDRLVNLYPSLRDEVQKILGLTAIQVDSSQDWFAYDFTDENYGVYCRHGHEFDPFNYAGTDAYTRSDYLQIPIGDVVTTEVAVKLACVITEKLTNAPLDEERKKEIIAYVQQIDDVRPVSSIVHWLYQEVKDDPHMLVLLGSAVVEVAAQLLEIPFVKDWFQRHGGTARPVREEKLSWEWIPSEVLDTLENYVTNPLVVLKSIFSYAEDQGTAVHRKAALSDYRRLQDQGHQDVRFLLQGHTHVPDQCPLDRLKDAVGIYFNTGTWRPMFHETLAVEDGCKYVQLKHVTYLVLYRKNEDTAGKKNDTPGCDVWTGFGYKR